LQHLRRREAKAGRPLVTAVSNGVSPSAMTAVRRGRDWLSARTSLQNPSWPWMEAMWMQVFPYGVVPSSRAGSCKARRTISVASPDTAALRSRLSIPGPALLLRYDEQVLLYFYEISMHGELHVWRSAR